MSAIWDWFWFAVPWELKAALGVGICLALLAGLAQVIGWDKAWKIAAAVGAVFAALTFINRGQQQAYRKGVTVTEEKQEERADDLEQRFREVESDGRTVDDAVGGLRQRAKTRVSRRSVPKPPASNRKGG
jgi:hypothetical protein